ncbi:small heat-shock protein, putative [Ricinus communis]|uniref:Small heat-shock protein, putative n=2 Tax=Ricinus communis TaxID=3988 RepID=B9RQ27_RICCO|nr:small heat-shock protein, putative [Ricinus communis]|eukprot:XP_002515846.1 inactive protein RESTRICTED TEV MOVEMENT 2 [Ricinus communis]
MEPRQRTSGSAERVYEDLEPIMAWERDHPTADTLVIYLPGFRKEQLKVQVTTSRFLRVSGERLVSGNKWIRFRKEILIPSNYETNEISAKFEKGALYVKHPKIIVQDPEPPQEKRKDQALVEAPKPGQEKPAEPPNEATKLLQEKVQLQQQPPTNLEKSTSETQAKGGPKIEMDRQKSSKMNGRGDSDNNLQKMIEKEKELSKYEEKNKNDAGKVVTSTSTSTIKQENVHDSVQDAKDKTTTESCNPAKENYRQV